MPSALIPKDKEISEEILLLRRMVQMMSQQNAVDQGNRQKVTIDAVTVTSSAVTLPVNIAGSTGSINVSAMAGEGVRMYEVPARNCYSNSIRNKLTFA